MFNLYICDTLIFTPYLISKSSYELVSKYHPDNNNTPYRVFQKFRNGYFARFGNRSSQDQNDAVYLDGITIKCYDWAIVGATGEVNDSTYTVVDKTMLRKMADRGADVTTVCTSMVTDMSELFARSSFNQDIST